jgi:hypothetical protein
MSDWLALEQIHELIWRAARAQLMGQWISMHPDYVLGVSSGQLTRDGMMREAKKWADELLSEAE